MQRSLPSSDLNGLPCRPREADGLSREAAHPGDTGQEWVCGEKSRRSSKVVPRFFLSRPWDCPGGGFSRAVPTYEKGRAWV